MAKYDQFDPADSWQRRREQSLRARNIKITEATPKEERRWRIIDRIEVAQHGSTQQSGVVSGRWSSRDRTADWTRYGGGGDYFHAMALSQFVEIKPRPSPAPKFQPGDMVELLPGYTLESRLLSGALEVVCTTEHFGMKVVSFVGEQTTLYEHTLQLKDGPW